MKKLLLVGMTCLPLTLSFAFAAENDSTTLQVVSSEKMEFTVLSGVATEEMKPMDMERVSGAFYYPTTSPYSAGRGPICTQVKCQP